jgi:protein-disulfide isomerase
MAEVPQIKLTEKVVPILLVLVIGMAFALGIMWQKVSNLENGSGPTVAGETNPSTPSPDVPQSGKLTEDQVKKLPEVSDADHIRGSRDAEVFLVEYSDLECPFCARFHPTAQQAVDEYQGKVAWVYRHFPLVSLHSYAQAAAEASECIAELGGEDAFWNFADEVFLVQEQGLSNDLFYEIAGKIGVDSDSVKNCVEDGKYKDKITEQQVAGGAAGVTGTPGSFIVNKNGSAWLLPGAVPFENLKSVIEEALSE